MGALPSIALWVRTLIVFATLLDRLARSTEPDLSKVKQ